jgi:hypothetical protein
MDRASLDHLTPEELHQQVMRYRLVPTAETREAYIDALVQHFDNFRSALEENQTVDMRSRRNDTVTTAASRAICRVPKQAR